MDISAAASDGHVEDEYQDLVHEQRLKASVYHTVMELCKEVEVTMDTKINKQVTAAIAETVSRQLEHYARDAELFANHAKRSTVNIEDIKLLARKTPGLVNYLNEMLEKKVTTNPGNKTTKSSDTTTEES